MSLWHMLVYVAIIKATKMMSTNNFNSKDIGVINVIQEMKISNTSDGLVLSQLHERCDNSLVRIPYMKSICIFWEVFINLNNHALLDTCASYLYILVGHRIMVGLYIFVGDNTMSLLLSNGSTSKL